MEEHAKRPYEGTCEAPEGEMVCEKPRSNLSHRICYLCNKYPKNYTDRFTSESQVHPGRLRRET
jgi:hypothetical protein